jgi:hypothetical protein
MRYGDPELAELWSRLMEIERRLEAAWAAVDAQLERRSGAALSEVQDLADAADRLGFEHDDLVRRIGAAPARSWRGVTLKLMACRLQLTAARGRGALEPHEELMLSAYLDALRLSRLRALAPDADEDEALRRALEG